MRRITTGMAFVLVSVSTLSAQQATGLRVGLSAPRQSALATHSAVVPSGVERSQWAKGAAYGAGIGLVASVAMYFIARNASDAPESIHPVPVFLGSTFIFALIGGMIGSGIHPKD
jgi:hypothetical protein